MLNFMNKLKLEKAEDGTQGGGGGTGYEDKSSEEPKTPSESEKEGDSTDDFGYEQTPEEDAGKKKEEAGDKGGDSDGGDDTDAGDDDKVEKPATGYGEDGDDGDDSDSSSDKEADKKDDDKSDDKSDDEPSKDELPDEEIKTSLAKLPEAEASAIGDFAKKHKLSKEVIKDYAEMREAENTEMAKQRDQAVKDQRKSWTAELQNDKDFGGENFGKNVMRAEKVLELMPDLKKVLTDKGTMLPPYVMKGLAGLHKPLFQTGKIVKGQASTPKDNEDEGNFLDTLYT